MTWDEVAVNVFLGDGSYTAGAPPPQAISRCLARAHAEGLEAAARMAGQIYSVPDIGLDDGPSVVGDKLALAIRSLIPAAPEVIRPAAEEVKDG